MCKVVEDIKTRQAKNASGYAKEFWDETLTTASKATLDAEQELLYLERRDHKFLGHDGLGCPDA